MPKLIKVAFSVLTLIAIVTLIYLASGLDYDDPPINDQHYEEASRNSDAWYDVFLRPSNSGYYDPIRNIPILVIAIVIWLFKKRK
jgi:hypothetical protein